MTDTNPPEPVRKGLLPTTPPPEWEFSSAFATGPDGEPGLLLVPGDAGPVVVRRSVAYGDWEPVRPDHWAEEPPSDVRAASVPASTPTDRAAEEAEPVLPIDRCTCRQAVHATHHKTPVDGCIWCASAAEQPDGEA